MSIITTRKKFLQCARRGTILPEHYEVREKGRTVPRKELYKEAEAEGIPVQEMISAPRSRLRKTKDASILMQIMT